MSPLQTAAATRTLMPVIVPTLPFGFGGLDRSSSLAHLPFSDRVTGLGQTQNTGAATV
jgi:hypothetical protein